MKLSALYILLLGVVFGLAGCHDGHHHSDDSGTECQSGNCGDNGDGNGNGNGGGDDNGNGNDNGNGGGDDNGGGGDNGNDGGDDNDNDNGSGSGSGDDNDNGGGNDDTCDPELDDDCDIVPAVTDSVSISLDGVVIDGYIVDAQVCLDLNENYKCDSGEPSVKTRSKGAFSFNTTLKQADLEGTSYACLATGNCGGGSALRLLVWTGRNTKNVILGNESPMAANVALTTLAFLDSVDAGSSRSSVKYKPVVLTPFSTLAALKFAGTNGAAATVSPESFSDALYEVTGAMGVDPKAATSDYNDPGNMSARNIRALIAGEILVRRGLMPQNLTDLESRSYEPLTSEDLTQMADSVREDVNAVEKEIQEGGGTAQDIADTLVGFSDSAAGNLVSLAGNGIANYFWCALNKAGNVLCWGNNSQGVLGDPNIFPKNSDGTPVADGYIIKDNFSPTPVTVKLKNGTPLSGVISLTTGSTHACAVTAGGDVYCWGGNAYGEVGNGEISDEPVLYAQQVVKEKNGDQITYLTNAESVTLNDVSSCALVRSEDDTTKEAWCWGDNTVQQLGAYHPDKEVAIGQGMKSPEGIPLDDFLKAIPYAVKVPFPKTVKSVTSIAGGMWSFCALVENTEAGDLHNLYCWGDDTRGLVSHNWLQYQEDFLKNYAGVLMYQDQSDYADYEKGAEGTKPWFWRIYHSKGWDPLYGAPVTAVTAAGSSWYSNRPIRIEAGTESGTLPNNICDAGNWFAMNSAFAANTADRFASGLENFESNGIHIFETLIGACTTEDHDGCTIDSVEMQYTDDNGNVRAVTSQCSSDSSDWTDETFEDNGFDSASMFLSGVWVNVNRAVRRTEQLELKNVTKVAITDFDSGLLVELDHSSRIWDIYNNGSDSSFWTLADHPNGESIKKIEASVENNVIFLLTTEGNAYNAFGQVENNKTLWGMAGVGKEVVSYLATPLLPDGSPLQHIDEISVNLRSVCATAAVPDKDGKSTSEKALYCWGSSVMGQLGFDNMDGGFSMEELNSDWDGQTRHNKYIGKMSRIEFNPRKVEFSTPASGE